MARHLPFGNFLGVGVLRQKHCFGPSVHGGHPSGKCKGHVRHTLPCDTGAKPEWVFKPVISDVAVDPEVLQGVFKGLLNLDTLKTTFKEYGERVAHNGRHTVDVVSA